MINISLPTINQKMTQARKLFSLLLCLAVGQMLMAQTYTTIADFSSGGSIIFDNPSNWLNGQAPPNPIPAGATVEIRHQSYMTASLANWTNNGTIDVSNGGFFSVGNVLDNYGTINIADNHFVQANQGTLNNKSGGKIQGWHFSLWNTATLNNEAGGMIELKSSLNKTSQGSNVLNNAGTIIITEGSFISRGQLTNSAGGLIEIRGTQFFFNSPFSNSGAVRLLNAVRMSRGIAGGYTGLAGSSLEWVLSASGSAGTDYPTVSYSLADPVAAFAQTTLIVSLATGYEPAKGDQFNLFFGFPIPTNAISLPALSNGNTWQNISTPNQIIVEVPNESCQPTAITCPGNITVGNDNGDCGAIVTFTLPDGATAIPSSGSFFPVGTTTVEVEGSDGCDGTSTCSFTVTVNDTEAPTINFCPSPIVNLNNTNDRCGAIIVFSPTPEDNCPGASIEQTEGLASGSLFPIGSTTVVFVAKDAANLTTECRFTVNVKDNQAPIAVCKDVTVEFNGEASIDLTPSQVWNQAASSDNCGNVYYAGASPSLSISCDDLGNTIPLTVTIHDGNGNMDNCTADVTVTGLPCGWSEGPDDGSLNCAGNTDVDYDIVDESFAVSADGCWHDCRESDKAAYVYQELCGDGTLTARLASINTSGYAGLMLRESLDPDARRAGALKNYSTRRVRREYRSTYGGIVTQSHSNRSRVKWFRIVRKGDEVKSYTSSNGSYWRLLYRVILPNLDDCVKIGMMAYSSNGSSTVDAVFDNVSFSGSGSSLIDNNNSLPNTFTAFDTDLTIEQPDVNIFPNPSNGQSQIELNGFPETPAQIMVRDAFGKVVRQIEVDYPEGTILPLELQDMPAGLYLISVMQDQQEVITKKLMIQR